MTDAHKRALIAAFFLSKFDRKGVRSLGYETFDEAFTRIGADLGVKPSTVKHMRDSFDPYCSRVRVGWYQRKILPSRANVIEAYDEVSEEAMIEVVSELFSGDANTIQAYTAPITARDEAGALTAEDTPFATRLRTGEKAETFFMQEYPHLTLFAGSVLEDTRKLGIGFDFRTSFGSGYYAVEVKGVRDAHGSISFTDKEWSVARILGSDYVLALVRSLDAVPTLDLIRNPVHHVPATMQSIKSVSVCWNARV